MQMLFKGSEKSILNGLLSRLTLRVKNMKNLTSFLAVTILCITSFSQDSNSYAELIEEAENLYESKEYHKSGQKYSEAFLISGNNLLSFGDRYAATVTWAKAYEIDSAFRTIFMNTEWSGMQKSTKKAYLKLKRRQS